MGNPKERCFLNDALVKRCKRCVAGSTLERRACRAHELVSISSVLKKPQLLEFGGFVCRV